MKKGLCVLGLCCMAGLGSAQMKQATFEDGTILNYEIKANTPDKIKPVILKINIVNPEIGIQYYRKNTFMVEGAGGLMRSGLDFTYYVFHTGQEKKQNLTVHSAITGYNTTTKYMIKGNSALVEHNWGIHGGISYINPNILNLSSGFSALQIAAGIGHFKNRHIAWFVEDPAKKTSSTHTFTRRSGFYADLLYFANAKMSDKYINLYTMNGSVPLPSPRTIGWQFYFEGSGASGEKESSEWGYFWRIGWAMGLNTSGWPVYGLGLAI
ncbi:MAG: hypothetical protein ACHQRM_15605 [Bacteroidia bacterium]